MALRDISALGMFCLKQVLAPVPPKSSLRDGLLTRLAYFVQGWEMTHSQKPQWKGCSLYFALNTIYYLIKSATDTGISYKLQDCNPTPQIDNFNNSPPI